jgi:hypothetical protein
VKKNIELCLQLKELGEKLGFGIIDYDGMDRHAMNSRLVVCEGK